MAPSGTIIAFRLDFRPPWEGFAIPRGRHTGEPKVIADRWFLSVCYPKAMAHGASSLNRFGGHDRRKIDPR
jgi:hypothetical protein